MKNQIWPLKLTTRSTDDMEQAVASIREICEYQPEAMIWVTPVFNEHDSDKAGDIIDFKVRYSNPAVIELIGHPGEQLVGKCIRADKVPDSGITDFIFEQCLQVYETGAPLQYPYYSQKLDKHIVLSRSKVKGGVLTSARNRTAEQHTKQEKEAQSRFIESLVDNSPYGISVYESIRDADNDIVDFKLKLANKKSSEITAFSPGQLQEYTVKQLIAIRGHSQFFEICAEVVNTGKPRYIEYYAETRDQWIGFSIVKFDDGYLLNYIDITETKKYEQEAKMHAKELDALFNSSVSVVYSATVVRNSAQKIIDIVFLRVNESFQRVFSLRAEDVVGRRLSMINVHDDHATFLGYVEEAMSSGLPYINQLQYSNPDRWFEVSFVRLDAATVSVTLNDITAEKNASLEIERQRNLLDAILKQIPNGLAITKALRNEHGKMIDGTIVLANEACEELNGFPGEVLLSATVATLDPSLPDSPLFAAVSDLPVGSSLRTEFFMENTRKWVELAIARMDADHFINVMTDITALKSTHQKLETTVADLQEANANLEHFAYAASHDLKEPVRKIRMYAEQIKRGYGGSMNDTHDKQFEKLEAAAERMSALIENLLLYAHANTGIPQVEPVDLNSIFQDVLDDLEFALTDTSANVHVQPLPVVSGYKPQLHQLFQNLLANSIKYHKTGIAPDIQVSYSTLSSKTSQFAQSNPDRITSFHAIEIRDNGIGFDQNDADRIFQVFTRLHSKHQYPGTGVGLSIVKKAAENHGGYVTVKSTPGQGSSFTVYLPFDESLQR